MEIDDDDGAVVVLSREMVAFHGLLPGRCHRAHAGGHAPPPPPSTVHKCRTGCKPLARCVELDRYRDREVQDPDLRHIHFSTAHAGMYACMCECILLLDSLRPGKDGRCPAPLPLVPLTADIVPLVL
jgi:hypothetical protein